MSDDSRGKSDDGKLLYCSFCGKSQHEGRSKDEYMKNITFTGGVFHFKDVF